MATGRILAVGALATALVGLHAGCDAQKQPDPRPRVASSSAAPTPEQVLRAAAGKAAEQNMRFTLTAAGTTFQGTYDEGVTGANIKAINGDDGIDAVAFPQDLWIGGLEEDGKYVHAKIAQLRRNSAFLLVADPLAALTFLRAVVGVTETTPGNFGGTIRLTDEAAFTTPGPHKLAEEVVADTAITELPFRATLDGQGRLASFQVTLPKIDDGRDVDYQLTITSYGEELTVARPMPSKTVEADEFFYAL
jgi:hypothetical protein